MTSKKGQRNLILITVLILMAVVSGCRDLFNNPLQDKETGNDVTVLLMDRNFIKTKLDIRLEDAVTGVAINSEEVEIRFSGKGAGHLITFTGNLMTSFKTNSGFMEVGYDPNMPLDQQNPLELTVIALSAGYISAPQFLSYTTEGVKNVTIKMIRRSSAKSATPGPYSEPYDILFNGVLHAPQLSFIADISTSSTGTAWDYLNLYTASIGGSLLCNNLKDNVFYSDFGVYYFGMTSGSILVPPASPVKNAGLQAGDYVYSAILRSGQELCPGGLTLHVERSDGKPGSGMFDYLITFPDGRTRSGKVTCTFPSEHLIEQIYFPASNPAVNVWLSGDAQYDMSASVNLASPCGTRASFNASPKGNLMTYKLITQYVCSDSHIGMALTLVGEFRKSGSMTRWNTFEFIGGICDLMLEQGADYDFRVNIDGEYHSYTVPTDPAAVETFLISHQGEDYTLRRLIVNQAEDAVYIIADVEFGEDWCNSIR